MSTIKITLSAANMGPDATEADFDAWASFVNERIEHVVDAAIGIRVDVEQAAFIGPNAEPEDMIHGATEDQRDTVREWLSVDGWNAFCVDMDARVAA